MKYYVYVEKEDNETKNHIFVVNLKEFANTAYNPNTMEFTGVIIDADNALSAKVIYDSPTENSSVFGKTNILWSDEPLETIEKRHNTIPDKLIKLQDAVKKAEQAAYSLQASMLTIQIAEELQTIHYKMEQLAHIIRLTSTNSPHTTELDIFKTLKEKYIEQFKQLPYSGE